VTTSPAALALLVITAIVLVPSAGTALPPRAPQYTITDLGTLGGVNSQANAINDKGEIVGWSETANADPRGNAYRNAFRWEASDGMQRRWWRDLNSEANDINSAGETVGWAESPGTLARHAILWRSSTSFDLNEWFTRNNPPQRSFALSINDRQQIVGGVYDENSCSDRGALFCKGAIRSFDYNDYAVATDVNRRGDIVGYAEANVGGRLFSVRWPGAKSVLRRPRLGYFHQKFWDKAYGINDLRYIVGTSERGAYVAHNGRTLWLPALPGDHHAVAMKINNRGHIVGASLRVAADGGEPPLEAATLWIGQRPLDLDTLVENRGSWQLEEARDINERRQIVGVGFPLGRAAGVRHAFLLTPR
jgi:probable HAF family extracellular repeat protein